MVIFVVTAIALLLIIAAMAIGVLMGRKPISGSCGGIGAALGEENYTCEICGGDPEQCDEQQDRIPASKRRTDQLAYNADRRLDDTSP